MCCLFQASCCWTQCLQGWLGGLHVGSTVLQAAGAINECSLSQAAGHLAWCTSELYGIVVLLPWQHTLPHVWRAHTASMFVGCTQQGPTAAGAIHDHAPAVMTAQHTLPPGLTGQAACGFNQDAGSRGHSRVLTEPGRWACGLV